MDWKKTFYKYLENGVFYHVLFWIVFYLFLIIVDHSVDPIADKLTNKLILVIFFMLIVYFNLLFLFPKYLKQNKFFLYAVLLVFGVVAIVPIESFIHYLFFFRKKSVSEIFNLENNSKIFLGGFFMAFASTLYKIISDWAVHQKEKIELQKQSLQSELNFLKSQINPHFLFNTLNSLYALTLKKSDKAPEIVLRLSEMMRYMLYECNEPKVPLSKEIKYVNNYLELEKLRHGQNFEIDLNIDGNINGQHIAPLVFIPFLENSFKHGIDNHLNQGYVKIDINVKEEELNLKVVNSKQKMPINKPKKSGGIGLVNIRRRLALVYPNKHKLELNNTDNRYDVSLSLNLSS